MSDIVTDHRREASFDEAYNRIRELEDCLYEFIKLKPTKGTAVVWTPDLFARAEKLVGIMDLTTIQGGGDV